MSKYQFRKAVAADSPQIWVILQQAIQRRKEDGSKQWQDGYPNETVVANDIANGYGYVLADGETIVAYTAVLLNDEPEYAKIEGKWITNDEFVVFHRVAISNDYLGQGLAVKLIQHIEEIAIANNIKSIKADTNFDNPAMVKIFEKLGYVFCGVVHFRGSPRNAFELVLERL